MATTRDGEYEVTLVVNGKRVPMKSFVQQILGGGIVGMVESLKGIGEAEVFEVTIRRATRVEKPL